MIAIDIIIIEVVGVTQMVVHVVLGPLVGRRTEILENLSS